MANNGIKSAFKPEIKLPINFCVFAEADLLAKTYDSHHKSRCSKLSLLKADQIYQTHKQTR